MYVRNPGHIENIEIKVTLTLLGFIESKREVEIVHFFCACWCANIR